jgi:hypothetical protein
MPNSVLRVSLLGIVFFLAACAQYPETCPSSTPVGLINAQAIASNDGLPFRFPLDQSAIDGRLFFGWFGVSNECPPNAEDCFDFQVKEYHAAEDYRQPAGTPVFAMADGRISFSGPMGGYGWLIIIDHPQANLYSLYGHLSPSRWRMRSGTVQKGELIAFLGDPDENGGSKEHPLEPHLHFGVRCGQRSDYPGRGEWRFMAGWIKPCPQDVGWLQPSIIITSQGIPAGGYPTPAVGFLVRWGGELLITAIYTIGGIGMLVWMVRKKAHKFFIFPCILVIAAGIVFPHKGITTTYSLLLVGILMLVSGIYLYFQQANQNHQNQK